MNRESKSIRTTRTTTTWPKNNRKNKLSTTNLQHSMYLIQNIIITTKRLERIETTIEIGSERTIGWLLGIGGTG